MPPPSGPLEPCPVGTDFQHCEAAGIRQQDVGNGEKSLVLDTQWNSRHIEAQFTRVSRLSPPCAAGWRNGMVGD